MYIMYVDESGDPGIAKYNSKHFILSGVIVHQDEWQNILDRMKTFRSLLYTSYSFNKRTELHAKELIRFNKNKDYSKIRKSDRMRIYQECCTNFPIIFQKCKIINIAFHKETFSESTDFQLLAWERLITRYDTYLKKVGKDKGIIISDDTDNVKIKAILRKLRIYNPISSKYYNSYYNPVIENVIEDIIPRDSKDSYFVQVADMICHSLYRKEYPKTSLKKFRLESQFDKFKPLLLLEASNYDELGIVRK